MSTHPRPVPAPEPPADRAEVDPYSGLYGLVNTLVEAWESMPPDTDVSWWMNQQVAALRRAGWRPPAE